MGTLKRFNLRRIRQHGFETLIDVGAGLGDSLQWGKRCGFSSLCSVETDNNLYQQAVELTSGDNLRIEYGDSVSFLMRALLSTHSPRLVYFDVNFTVDGVGDDLGRTPVTRTLSLLEELSVLQNYDCSRDIILIDDANLFYNDNYQAGICPEGIRRWKDSGALEQHLAKLSGTHQRVNIRNDQGYILLVPHYLKDKVAEWFMFLPSDNSGPMSLQAGVPGATCVSMQRRFSDHRFATRYFRGFGIDVGGGQDSLALYREFFPLIKGVFLYDLPRGDAQTLENIADESFDFLFSSHCLEHMRDPRVAIRNWLRVVKPGGYLVVVVPDEDLYEQGQWPSKFNQDHKLTFTIAKEKSWSPVSFNVVDLIREIAGEVRTLKIEQVDWGYRYSLQGSGFDQTRTPLAEPAIEFIVSKL